MEQTDPIREVVQQIQLDLSFLQDSGVIPHTWVEDSRRYLRKRYDDYIKEQRRRAPLQVDQPPLRPSSPLLVDIDSEVPDSSHGRYAAYQSSAPRTSTTASALLAGPTHIYPATGYDLDQHEWEAAAEWGGTRSSTSQSDDTGQAMMSPLLPSAPVGEFAIRGTASTRSNRRRSKGTQSSYNNQQRRSSRQQKKQEQQWSPTAAATVVQNGTRQPHTPTGPPTNTSPETNLMLDMDGATKNQTADTSPSPGEPAQGTICPYFLTFGSCRREADCQLQYHTLVGGLPREKLECSFWRSPLGCLKAGCQFEHHATAHGVQGSIRGRGR